MNETVFGYLILFGTYSFTIFFSHFCFAFKFRFRRYVKHERTCFTAFRNTSTFVKNTPGRVVISTLFSVFFFFNLKHIYAG